MKTFNAPVICPACQTPLPLATTADRHNRGPQAGDVCMCFKCGAFNWFNEEILLAPMSDQEFLELPDETRLELTRVKQKWLVIKHGH